MRSLWSSRRSPPPSRCSAATHLTAGSYFFTLVVAYGAFAALMVALHRRVAVPAWPVLLAGGALLVVAMIQPPIESGDVWSYASYGRMVTLHHDSPWTHVPADYPHDPYTRRRRPILASDALGLRPGVRRARRGA